MGIVVLDMAMSVDGFAADANGRSVYPIEGLRGTASLENMIEATGAVVMGRRAYDMARGDFTNYEYQVPIFVLTHHAPNIAARGTNACLSFTFVNGEAKHAIEQARAAAGGKDVTVIGGPCTFQQCINAGVVDEIQLRLMPFLVGRGLALFEEADVARVQLETTSSAQEGARTDMRFRVRSG